MIHLVHRDRQVFLSYRSKRCFTQRDWPLSHLSENGEKTC
jgi:hypothetical protein